MERSVSIQEFFLTVYKWYYFEFSILKAYGIYSTFWRKKMLCNWQRIFEVICCVKLRFWKPKAVAKSQESSISLAPPIHVHILRSRLLTVNYDIPLIDRFHFYNWFILRSAVCAIKWTNTGEESQWQTSVKQRPCNEWLCTMNCTRTTQLRCESYEFMDYRNNDNCETIHFSASYLKNECLLNYCVC
jgi:hypothetical protein